MSLRHIIKAFDSEVGNPVYKLVLIKLADNSNEQGWCWPSLDRIAKQCECSKRTVINAIKSLESVGLISVKREKTDNKTNKVNNYFLFPNSETDSLPSEPYSPPSESPAPPPSELDSPLPSESPAPKSTTLEPTTLEPSNESLINSEFEFFWNTYGKKVDKEKVRKKWDRLTKLEKQKIFKVLDDYVLSTPEPQYRKNPLTWLNGKCWNDEIIFKDSNPLGLSKAASKTYSACLDWLNEG